MRVVIVGAGLLGICTAYFLGRAGLRPLVIERHPGPGAETSFANGGMITPSQSDPWNRPGVLGELLHSLGREDAPILLRPSAIPSMLGWGLAFLHNSRPAAYRRNLVSNARLAQYSVAMMKQLRADTGIQYRQAHVGTMAVYRDAGALRIAAGYLPTLAQHEIPASQLDRDGVLAREPALQPIAAEIAGGIFYAADESGDAFEFTGKLAELAEQAGAEFRYGVAVEGFRRGGQGVASLATSAGDLSGDAYVLACGSYTPLIARQLGTRLPIYPIKGYSITLDMRSWQAQPVIPIVDNGHHIAATPLGTQLRVAGTAEFNRYDVSINPRRIANMVDFVRRTFPAEAHNVNDAEVNAWAGLRPYSCDGVPIIGPTSVPNVFVNSGHGHLGWTLCAGSGRLLADLISGRSPDIDPAPYSLRRF
jgi:D-amino-acid dehydrogenase